MEPQDIPKELRHQAAQLDAARRNTSAERLVEEFGEERLEGNPLEGDWQITLKTTEEKKRFSEMDRERQEAVERSCMERQSETPTVKLTNARGERVEVPEHMAEMLDRKWFNERKKMRGS